MQVNASILKIVCLFWLIAKIISINAWLTNRLFPVVPPFEVLANVPSIVHKLLFYASCLCLSVILFFKVKRSFIIVLLVLELTSCMLDIIRWQPWEYQYIFILLAFLFCKNTKAFYTSLLFILSSLYIFSGLHKFNGGFLHYVWERILLHGYFGFSYTFIKAAKLHYAGVLLAFIETACGVALLLMKDKKWPLALLAFMHVFVLFALGPLGIDYNSVIWPWNLAMIIVLYNVQVNSQYLKGAALIPKIFKISLLLFWCILPIANFAGYWDSFLSSSLYSGNSWNATICISNTSTTKVLQEYYIKYDRFAICNGDTGISMHNWAITELNVVPYSEIWYFKKFIKAWDKKYPDASVKFIVSPYPYKVHTEIR